MRQSLSAVLLVWFLVGCKGPLPVIDADLLQRLIRPETPSGGPNYLIIDPDLARSDLKTPRANYRLVYDSTRNTDLWWFEPDDGNPNPGQWANPDDLETLKRLQIDPASGEEEIDGLQTGLRGHPAERLLSGHVWFTPDSKASLEEVQRLTGKSIVRHNHTTIMSIDLTQPVLQAYAKELQSQGRGTFIEFYSSINVAKTEITAFSLDRKYRKYGYFTTVKAAGGSIPYR